MIGTAQIRKSIDALRSSKDVDRTALAAGAVGLALLLGAFASFVLQLGWGAYLFAGFLAVVAYGWYAHQALTAKGVTFLMTASTVVMLGLITAYIFYGSLEAFQVVGANLFATDEPIRVFGVTVLPVLPGAGYWNSNYVPQSFSLIPLMWGTVATTVIATLIAAPLGVAAALFIGEIAPGWVREIVKPGVEMLAGIPSIVYGFIGFAILNEYLYDHLSLPGQGSLFLAGVMIGLMALPTVVSVAEDAIDTVPAAMKDGSLAVGATDWQTMTNVTVPASFSGVSAGVLLGVGRAVGETMAATAILGNSTAVPQPFYDVFGNTITLTTAIASQYGNASGVQLSVLFAAGVVLFVTVMAISVFSQLIERRMQKRLGGNS